MAAMCGLSRIEVDSGLPSDELAEGVEHEKRDLSIPGMQQFAQAPFRAADSCSSPQSSLPARPTENGPCANTRMHFSLDWWAF